MHDLNQQRTKIEEDVSGTIARILDKKTEKFELVLEAKRCSSILGDSWCVIVGLSISKRGSFCKIIVVAGIIANDGCTPR
jgi:hypothetical protein